MKILKAITAAVAVALVMIGCDVSTESYFEIVNEEQGITDYGVPYLELTVENVSNGSGRDVRCLVTVSDFNTDKVYGKGTAYFGGGILEPGEQETGRVMLPGLLVAQELIAREQAKLATQQRIDGGSAEEDGEAEVPILVFNYELSWEDMNISGNERISYQR